MDAYAVGSRVCFGKRITQTNLPSRDSRERWECHKYQYLEVLVSEQRDIILEVEMLKLRVKGTAARLLLR